MDNDINGETHGYRESKPRGRRSSYLGFLGAAYGHAVRMMVRQRRLILAVIVCLLPAALPIVVLMFAPPDADVGDARTFTLLAEHFHINGLAPLLALFFAAMLIGQDVEGQTIPYVLVRPIPRLAWVLGRFLAYGTVTAGTLAASIVLTFAACTTLEGLNFSAENLLMAAHYIGVAAVALLSYGALTMYLGAATKRPIVYGVALMFGWQPFAMLVPGLVDFLTFRKYTDAILPEAATGQAGRSVISEILEIQKQMFAVGEVQAILTLALVSAVFVALTVHAVRSREYAAAHAADH